jgi:hypothetical protein
VEVRLRGDERRDGAFFVECTLNALFEKTRWAGWMSRFATADAGRSESKILF